jgi:tetratricopeptide (TPR) repeat protein
MITANQLDGRVKELGKSSRKAAILSLIGFLLVLAAIGYAITELNALERQRASLLKEQQGLKTDTERYRSDLARLRADLAKTRASLSAGRAAINAFHSGRLEDAVALYDEALASDSDNAYLQNLRAYSLFRLGRVDAAIEGQRRSIAADPKYAWGYFDLARFLCALSPPRVEEAKEAAKKAIELRPDMRAIIRGDGEFQRVCRHQVP